MVYYELQVQLYSYDDVCTYHDARYTVLSQGPKPDLYSTPVAFQTTFTLRIPNVRLLSQISCPSPSHPSLVPTNHLAILLPVPPPWTGVLWPAPLQWLLLLPIVGLPYWSHYLPYPLHHGNRGHPKVNLNDAVKLPTPENHIIEPKITTILRTTGVMTVLIFF